VIKELDTKDVNITTLEENAKELNDQLAEKDKLIEQVCIILSGQNRQRSSLWECIFDNMVLYFECRMNNKRTPSDRILTILPTGYCQF